MAFALTRVHTATRGRAEHVIKECVYSHRLFNGRNYQGNYEDLCDFTEITTHATALLIRIELSRQHAGFGNWAH